MSLVEEIELGLRSAKPLESRNKPTETVYLPTSLSSDKFPWYVEQWEREQQSNQGDEIQEDLRVNYPAQSTENVILDNLLKFYGENRSGDIDTKRQALRSCIMELDANAEGDTELKQKRFDSAKAMLESSDISKFKVHHYVDYIAGTSTGGYVTHFHRP